MWKETEVAEIDMRERTLVLHVNDPYAIKTLFRKDVEEVTKEDLIRLIKYQCQEYGDIEDSDLIESLKQTRGLRSDNNYWFKLNGDDFDYRRNVKLKLEPTAKQA